MKKPTAKAKSKLIVTMWITLDGFISGPNEELDWIMGDAEMSDYEIDLISKVDTLMLGRKTYVNFYDYWSPKGPPKKGWEKTFAQKINALQKIAVSKSLAKAEWKDSTILKALTAENVKKAKAESKKGIIVYGSASIVQQLTNLGLIDEYQLLLHPVLLGQGKKLFENVEKKGLKRVASKTFKSGVTVLTYRPDAKKEK